MKKLGVGLKISVLFALLFLVVLTIVPAFLSKRHILEYTISAPLKQNELFSQLIDLRKFNHWNGFLPSDSTLAINYYTPYVGKGASTEWNVENSNSINSFLKIKNAIENKSMDVLIFVSEVELLFDVKLKISKINDTHSSLSFHFTSEEIPYFNRYFNYWANENILKLLKKTEKKLNEWINQREERFLSLRKKPGSVGDIYLNEFYFIGKQVLLTNQYQKWYEEINLQSNEIRQFLLDSLNIPNDKLVHQPTLVLAITDENQDRIKKFSGWLGFKSEVMGKKNPYLRHEKHSEKKYLGQFYKGKFGFFKNINENFNSYSLSQSVQFADSELWLDFIKIPSADSLNYEINSFRIRK